MNYWLVKTEPDSYAYGDLEREGRTVWNGVSNSWALQSLRRMAPADRVLVYHTGKEKRIVGIAEVISRAYPDPEGDDPACVVVDLKAERKLPRPVSLAEIREDARFTDFELVRVSRLSVMPVSKERWDALLRMADASGV